MSTAEELDRLATMVGMFRFRNESDERMRDRIVERMQGYPKRVPFPDFEIYINTDHPELGRNIPPF